MVNHMFSQVHLNPQLMVKEALTGMTSKGFVRDDLKWEHVARLPVEPNSPSACWTVTPILIDLHRVSEIGEKLWKAL
jgi:hypothetical protein